MSSATGGSRPACDANGSRSLASGGPSMSTTSGRTAASARTRLRAEPGPWWRMPKKCSSAIRLELVAAGAVEIFPAVAFLDHGFEILAPDHGVLHRILDDRADQSRGHVVRFQTTVAEMTRQRHAVGN